MTVVTLISVQRHPTPPTPCNFHLPFTYQYEDVPSAELPQLLRTDLASMRQIEIAGFGTLNVLYFPIPILNLDPYSFEYAVVPCRTLCCGKVFCTEHLADVRTLFLLDVLFLNPFNSGYMDLKQKDAVLIVKTLAHLQAARFPLHRQLYILPRKPNAKAFLKQSILHHQLLSSCIWMTH